MSCAWRRRRRTRQRDPGGAFEDLEPDSVDLDLSGAVAGEVVVILVQGDTGLANDARSQRSRSWSHRRRRRRSRRPGDAAADIGAAAQARSATGSRRAETEPVGDGIEHVHARPHPTCCGPSQNHQTVVRGFRRLPGTPCCRSCHGGVMRKWRSVRPAGLRSRKWCHRGSKTSVPTWPQSEGLEQNVQGPTFDDWPKPRRS
jgi:hypothetical protein